MSQAFAVAPRTAHVSAMFRPSHFVREAVRGVTESIEGVADDWVHQAVVGMLGGGKRRDAYIELEHVSVFGPLPDYVLAVKCAAMRLGEEFQELDDVRYVLRAMNVTSVDDAISIVGPYFSERQLPPDIRDRLGGLLER